LRDRSIKKLWVNVVPYKKDLAIAALESGAEAAVLPYKVKQKLQDTAKGVDTVLEFTLNLIKNDEVKNEKALD